jgi:hypothetical protein
MGHTLMPPSAQEQPHPFSEGLTLGLRDLPLAAKTLSQSLNHSPPPTMMMRGGGGKRDSSLRSTMINMILLSFFDILSFKAQEKRCAIWLLVSKENQTHCNANRPRVTRLHMEQIPEGLSQQTMMGPTKVLDVTTGVQD